MTTFERTDRRTDEAATAADGDELSLAEFLPIDAVEDDLDAEPEDVEPHAADAELHAVTTIDTDFAFLAFGAVGPPMSTEVAETLAVDAARCAAEHEPDLEEILDATMHSHDPARDHDWIESATHRARPVDRLDVPDVHHRDEFVCSVCFLARPAHQRSAPGVDRCIDCA